MTTLLATSRQAALLVLAWQAFACAPSDEPTADSSIAAVDSAAVDTAAAPAQRADSLASVVFAYDVHGEVFLVRPVAVVDDSGVVKDPPDDASSAEGHAFIDAYLAAGAQRGAYYDGNAQGSIRIDSVGASRCTGLEAWGSWTGEGDLSQARSGVLLTRMPGGNFPSEEPTVDEIANAQAAAIQVLRDATVPADQLTKLLWQPARLVLGRDGYRGVVVAGHVPTEPTEDGLPPSVFAVVESAASAPRVTLSVVATPSRGGPQSHLVDVLDLDGDGALELLVQNISRYSWNYTIHRRQGGEWTTLFDGSDRGC